MNTDFDGSPIVILGQKEALWLVSFIDNYQCGDVDDFEMVLYSKLREVANAVHP